MLDYKSFNQEFFLGIDDIRWYDKDGYLRLDNNRVAQIILSGLEIIGQYEGYTVHITSKFTGDVAKKFFPFDQYFKRRIDNNTDYDGGFCIIDKCCYNNEVTWYMAEPDTDDIDAMANKIMEYIKIWN